jgi:hypothetical protein
MIHLLVWNIQWKLYPFDLLKAVKFFAGIQLAGKFLELVLRAKIWPIVQISVGTSYRPKAGEHVVQFQAGPRD